MRFESLHGAIRFAVSVSVWRIRVRIRTHRITPMRLHYNHFLPDAACRIRMPHPYLWNPSFTTRCGVRRRYRLYKYISAIPQRHLAHRTTMPGRVVTHHQRFENGTNKYQPTCRPNRRGVVYDAKTGVAAWGG